MFIYFKKNFNSIKNKNNYFKMMNNAQKYVLRILLNDKKNIFPALYNSSKIFQLNSKAFSNNKNFSRKILQTPEEIYSTPIYDKENPEFSDTYLNFLFNTNSKELAQLSLNHSLITQNITDLLKIYSTLSDPKAYLHKFNYVINYIYNNPENFSFFDLIKIFRVLIEKKLGDVNLLVKLNLIIGNKVLFVKDQSLKNKGKFEEFIHVFFNHFHLCSESGVVNRTILNSFLQLLSHDNYFTSLFSNEVNLNNVLFLISLSIASINELDASEVIERVLLDSDKPVVNLQEVVMIKKLLNFLEKYFETGDITEKTNSRNRLYKALKLLRAEGISITGKLDEFLAKYDVSQLAVFEADVLQNDENAKQIGQILEKIGVKFEKDKKFDICSVDYYVEPGICIIINGEDDFHNNTLKGKSNLVKRYLYLQNYDVLVLPYFIFENVAQIEEAIKNRFHYVANQEYDRISEKNKL